MILGHIKQRKDRIAGWNRLRDCYVNLSNHIAQVKTEIDQTKVSLTDVTNKYDQIAPERRDALINEVATQQKALGILGSIAEMKDEKGKLESAIADLKLYLSPTVFFSFRNKL